MKEDRKTLQQIAEEVKQDLNEKVDQWIRTFKKDTSDLGTFPSISQLEDNFKTLDLETRKIFLDMLSDALSNIDEKKIISEKKENCPKRG